MSAYLAAHGAIALSILSLLSCFLFVPLLVGKISSIQTFLETDSDEFKILSNEIWANIQSAKGGAVYRPRKVRQAAICSCDAFNSCGAGPIGPPGEAGGIRINPSISYFSKSVEQQRW